MREINNSFEPNPMHPFERACQVKEFGLMTEELRTFEVENLQLMHDLG